MEKLSSSKIPRGQKEEWEKEYESRVWGSILPSSESDSTQDIQPRLHSSIYILHVWTTWCIQRSQHHVTEKGIWI